MRLADFILANSEPILAEWEIFARNITPGAKMSPLALRDHAAELLLAAAADMKTAQTAAQQDDKSKGDGDAGAASDQMDGVSNQHAVGRVLSGFDLPMVVAEYRALRASVLRLWRESGPAPDLLDIADVTRFNESMDQSLTEAVRSYTEHVDRTRQTFLAILGHDLRNPLNAVMTTARLLSWSGKLDAKSSELVSRISVSASAMAELLSDLLDFTGGTLGTGMPISLAEMDLKSLCQEVVVEVEAAHPTRRVAYQPCGDLKGKWDAGRLRQLVSNLLGNAMQHGADNAPVDLSVSADASHILLAVRNEGPPIPPDVLPTIFEPLVRGAPDQEMHRRPGSIGLGLYIVREIAIAHGGAIDVKSSEEGGTVFTVRLPRRCESSPR